MPRTIPPAAKFGAQDEQSKPPSLLSFGNKFRYKLLKFALMAGSFFHSMVGYHTYRNFDPAPVVPQAQLMADKINLPEDSVFVIHSGMGDRINWAGSYIGHYLAILGVPPERIIILKSPYPQLNGSSNHSINQIWGLLFHKIKEDVSHWWTGEEGANFSGKALEGLRIYQQSANPSSDVVNAQYEQVARTMAERGMAGAPVVWIGHSAGGQMGLSVAEKSHNAPDAPFKVHTVMTLASPIMQNQAPAGVEIISITSSNDLFFKRLVAFDYLMNLDVKPYAPNLDGNDQAVEIPGPDHMAIVQDIDTWRCLLEKYLARQRTKMPQKPEGTDTSQPVEEKPAKDTSPSSGAALDTGAKK